MKVVTGGSLYRSSPLLINSMFLAYRNRVGWGGLGVVTGISGHCAGPPGSTHYGNIKGMKLTSTFKLRPLKTRQYELSLFCDCEIDNYLALVQRKIITALIKMKYAQISTIRYNYYKGET